jgi:uncharacterized protein YegP (UPF0339 family)
MAKIKFELYRDKKGDIRWRVRSTSNKKIIAESGEGYRRRIDCERAYRKLIESCRAGEYDFDFSGLAPTTDAG